MEALASAELVIEAIVEDLRIKTDLFQRLEQIMTRRRCWPRTPLRCQSQHWRRGVNDLNKSSDCTFSILPLMALVEVIPALQTKPGLADLAMSEMTAQGKTPPWQATRPGSLSIALRGRSTARHESSKKVSSKTLTPMRAKASGWGPSN